MVDPNRLKLLIPEAALEELRGAKLAALANTGIGGFRWTVGRLTGDGLGTAKTMTRVGELEGGISPAAPGRSQVSAPGQAVQTRPWELTVTGEALAIQPGDLLVSVLDPSIAFRVGALLRTLVYPIWEVSRAAPATIPPA